MIHALRLCNRFGKGKDAHVHKLPTEVISIIEDIIVSSTCEEISEIWDDSIACFEDRCPSFDEYYPAHGVDPDVSLEASEPSSRSRAKSLTFISATVIAIRSTVALRVNPTFNGRDT